MVVVVLGVRWKDSASGALRAIAIVFVTEVGCRTPGQAAGFETVTTVRLLVSVGHRGLGRHSRMYSGYQRCYHSRSSHHSLPQEDLPLSGRLWMLAV